MSKKTEKEYITGLQGVFEKSPSAYYWLVPSIFFILIVAMVSWMILSELDVVSQASAKIISSTGLHLIQPKDQGKIAGVPVKEGDEIEKGAILAEFEKQNLKIEIEGIQKEIQLLQADIYRLEALTNYIKKGQAVANSDYKIPNKILLQEKSLIQSQIDLFTSEMLTLETKIDKAEKEKKNIEAEISKLTKMIAITERKMNRLKALVHEKIISSEEYDQLWEDRISKIEDKKIKLQNIIYLNSGIELNKRERDKHKQNFYNENNRKLLEAYQKLENLIMKEKKAQELFKAKTIFAPISGVIHNLKIYTVGSVVKPGEMMMNIIPKDSPLEVEAKVLNRDIGFVHLGQKIKFKVDSFPFTKYGYIPGTIKKIENAAVKDDQLGDIYPIIVELDDNKIKVNQKWVQLLPGMSGMIDIQTGKRQMIEYILSPFLRYKDEAMKER